MRADGNSRSKIGAIRIEKKSYAARGARRDRRMDIMV